MSGIPAGAGSLLGKRLGKYEILALLALGGTAEIYLARIGGAAGFEKYVVVKCLHDHLADDPDFVKMFLDEARMAAMLDHSNIVQTFELGEYENRYYMVMEFLVGLSLAMVVRRVAERMPGGLLPVPLVLNIAAQAAAGLHYAHERTASGKPMNMVHRDISPQNLVVSFEGVVKVVDFGIARAELRETKTKAGTIKGKFAYMSPEQCVANNVDRRTDVFALGVIVHELLTGRRLFKRNSPYETYQAVLECAVEPPSKLNNQLDPALDAIVMKAVAKDKEQRYPTAEAFGDAMLGYLHHRGKGSGGNELARYFEQHFSQEMEEHGERMRELISGRADSVDTGMGWGEEEQANQTVDLSAKAGADAIGEIYAPRGSDASLDSFVGDLAEEQPDPDDMPADKTNIVQNPLEMIEQLNAQVARNSQQMTPVPAGSQTGGPMPLPAPPTGPQRQQTGPQRQQTGPQRQQPGPQRQPTGPHRQPTGPHRQPTGPSKAASIGIPSGKFPDLPNLPTVVAEEAEPSRPEINPNAVGARHTPPGVALQKTQHDMAAQQAPPGYDTTGPMAPAQGPGSGPQYAARPSGMQQAPMHMQQPNLGATAPAPVLHDYPVMPGGQRPFSTDLAPSNMHSQPQRSPYANAPFEHPAANLMSPVGQQYPQTDWERAASLSGKAMPTWMLVAIFGGALVGALLLTLVIAKIFS